MAENLPNGLRKVPVQDLLVGMFVARLDRPWAGTPFPVEGFFIRERDDILALRLHCDFVYTDPKRSRLKLDVGIAPPKNVQLKIEHGVYDAGIVPFKKEVDTAARLYPAISSAMVDAMEQLIADGEFAYLAMYRIAAGIIDGICRNPDTYAWSARVYDHETYAWRQEVRAAIRAAILARHIGLDKGQMLMLFLGRLLAHLPEVLAGTSFGGNAGVSADEDRQRRKRQVQSAVEILRIVPGMDDEVLHIVQSHRERHDGSGYPDGLQQDRIPMLARLSGIADYYEMLTNPRANGEDAVASAEAASILNELRGTLFHGQIISEFIQAIGLYATGSLVRLTTGEIAVVMEQNRERRLKPTVMLLLKASMLPFRKRKIVDLYAEEEQSRGPAREIAKSLPHGMFGIDVRMAGKASMFGF